MEDSIKRNKIARVIILTITYILLSFWALIVIFPFYWMILSSLKTYAEYSQEYIPKFYTLAPTFENYVTAWTSVKLLGYMINTVIYA